MSEIENFGGSNGEPVSPKTEPLAIVSLVLGILSVVNMCFGGLYGAAPSLIVDLILSAVTIVISVMAMSKVKKSNGALKGKGMAIAGLVMGIIVLVLSAINAVLYFSGFDKAMLNRYKSILHSASSNAS